VGLLGIELTADEHGSLAWFYPRERELPEYWKHAFRRFASPTKETYSGLNRNAQEGERRAQLFLRFLGRIAHPPEHADLRVSDRSDTVIVHSLERRPPACEAPHLRETLVLESATHNFRSCQVQSASSPSGWSEEELAQLVRACWSEDVLLVEGTSDAAVYSRLVPEHVCVASTAGANCSDDVDLWFGNWSEAADFRPRRVAYLFDSDDAGRQARKWLAGRWERPKNMMRPPYEREAWLVGDLVGIARSERVDLDLEGLMALGDTTLEGGYRDKLRPGSRTHSAKQLFREHALEHFLSPRGKSAQVRKFFAERFNRP
jgi:5S rRNA maturation endonuclease (ribonuclease M5)